MSNLTPFEGYDDFLHEVKERIRLAQVHAAFAVSRELIVLYWNIGHGMAERQSHAAWGDGALRRLADDLQAAFPGISGFSYRNLYRMRAFYLAYPDQALFVTQAVSQIPWGHNIVLLQKVKDVAVCLPTVAQMEAELFDTRSERGKFIDTGTEPIFGNGWTEHVDHTADMDTVAGNAEDGEGL